MSQESIAEAIEKALRVVDYLEYSGHGHFSAAGARRPLIDSWEELTGKKWKVEPRYATRVKA